MVKITWTNDHNTHMCLLVPSAVAFRKAFHCILGYVCGDMIFDHSATGGLGFNLCSSSFQRLLLRLSTGLCKGHSSSFHAHLSKSRLHGAHSTVIMNH